MKKVLFISLLSGFLFISCYQSRVIVGETHAPRVKTQTKWNSSLFGGLIPLSTKIEVGEIKYNSYEIYTRHTFLNMLVEGITCGIYSPTTTTVYVGFNKIETPSQSENAKSQEIKE